jgi:Flp pilus assembly protein TadG
MVALTENPFSLFLRDTSGSYLIICAVLMPVLVGVVGLGTDYGLWVHTHQTAQSATDSATRRLSI